MPAVDRTYSKSQITKAGRLFSEWVFAEPDARASTDHRKLVEAVAAIQWWRSLHARPLAKINAGLRYYIKQCGAPADVTQRLKRFGTIVHKLQREPNMALSQMEDIGGVRAILPAQKHVDFVRAGIGAKLGCPPRPRLRCRAQRRWLSSRPPHRPQGRSTYRDPATHAVAGLMGSIRGAGHPQAASGPQVWSWPCRSARVLPSGVGVFRDARAGSDTGGRVHGALGEALCRDPFSTSSDSLETMPNDR